jgi:glycosyltransferase involved in cell wall biosynthesis
VKLIHRSGKLGLGAAYVAGFRYALAHGYERVVETDADFSHRSEDLPALLAATRTANVVVGSRIIPGARVWLRLAIRPRTGLGRPPIRNLSTPKLAAARSTAA